MKLFKRIAVIAVLIVVVIVIGAYVAIDLIARNVVDSQGTAVLGVPTNVSSVRVAVFGRPVWISESDDCQSRWLSETKLR